MNTELPASSASPTQPVRGRRKKSDRIAYLTAEELKALLRAVRAGGRARDFAIFELAAGRGLRRGEVGLIIMEHLRLNAKRAWMEHLKGGISHEHTLLESELKALKAWRRERGDSPGAVFLSNWKRPIPGVHLNRLMRKYGNARAAPKTSCTFTGGGTRAVPCCSKTGAGIEEVQDHLGHGDVRNTMMHAKLTEKRRTALAKLLNEKRRR